MTWVGAPASWSRTPGTPTSISRGKYHSVSVPTWKWRASIGFSVAAIAGVIGMLLIGMAAVNGPRPTHGRNYGIVAAVIGVAGLALSIVGTVSW